MIPIVVKMKTKVCLQVALYVCVAFINVACVFQVSADNLAESLFTRLKDQVFQIRVIDIATGDKSTIGSGFLVSDQGHLASNFHVVSGVVHEPDKYRLEYLADDGSRGKLSVMAVDVVSDLALLKTDVALPNYFELSVRELAKGARIFSMGNPLDLGKTIIEGTFNGPIKNSRYQNFLFSGSLNSGMSGGPAIDASGAVIGVNVAKGGEQISFLVPVSRLKTLLDNTKADAAPSDFSHLIQQDLLADQERFYQQLLSLDNKKERLGELKLPGKMHQSLRCWGYTEDEEEKRYKNSRLHCRSDDQIFVHGDFYTGSFFYSYQWLTSAELNALQFGKVLQSRFKHRRHNNAENKKYITNYRCHTRFVAIAGHDWKTSSCFRHYKKYSGLYDALLLMASVDRKDRAAIIRMGASGISKKNATALFKNMMNAVEWEG